MAELPLMNDPFRRVFSFYRSTLTSDRVLPSLRGREFYGTQNFDGASLVVSVVDYDFPMFYQKDGGDFPMFRMFDPVGDYT